MISTVKKSLSLAIYGFESEDSSQAAPVIVSSPQGANVCHQEQWPESSVCVICEQGVVSFMVSMYPSIIDVHIRFDC